MRGGSEVEVFVRWRRRKWRSGSVVWFRGHGGRCERAVVVVVVVAAAVLRGGGYGAGHFWLGGKNARALV